MKVNSEVRPPSFFFHTQPRNHALTLIHFCDNPTETEAGWQYDEYAVEIATRPNMNEYIQNHYMELHAEAMGGPSAVQQLAANLDYISMMSGVDIPGGGEDGTQP